MNDTTTNHTPGPWFILLDPETDQPDTSYGHAIQADGNVTADSIGSRADANLIAAAPDLLACLKDAQARGQVAAATYRHLAKVRDEKANLGLAEEWQRFADFWAAAIAKAEGREG